MWEGGPTIALPVSDKSAEQTLQSLLAEMKQQTAILQTLQSLLAEMKQQTGILLQVAADVHAIWNQIDETPDDFKINLTKT